MYAMYGVPISIPLRWPAKGVDAVLDYSWDTTNDLAGLSDGLVMVTAAAQPSGAGELVILSLTFAAPLVTLVLAGGAAGRDYIVQLTESTAAGRVFEQEIHLFIDPTLAVSPLPTPPNLGFGPTSVWRST